MVRGLRELEQSDQLRVHEAVLETRATAHSSVYLAFRHRCQHFCRYILVSYLLRRPLGAWASCRIREEERSLCVPPVGG